MMKGLLIYVFGIDGSGKTTLLKMLEKSISHDTVCLQPFSGSYFTDELHNVAQKLNDNNKGQCSNECPRGYF